MCTDTLIVVAQPHPSCATQPDHTDICLPPFLTGDSSLLPCCTTALLESSDLTYSGLQIPIDNDYSTRTLIAPALQHHWIPRVQHTPEDLYLTTMIAVLAH